MRPCVTWEACVCDRTAVFFFSSKTQFASKLSWITSSEFLQDYANEWQCDRNREKQVLKSKVVNFTPWLADLSLQNIKEIHSWKCKKKANIVSILSLFSSIALQDGVREATAPPPPHRRATGGVMKRKSEEVKRGPKWSMHDPLLIILPEPQLCRWQINMADNKKQHWSASRLLLLYYTEQTASFPQETFL